jgi:hypothetical protein
MNQRPEPATFLHNAPTVRMLIEQAIESLLALLDTIDGEADLEPSLGAPERPPPECRLYLADIFNETSQEIWAAGGNDDQENPDDTERESVDFKL